MKQPVSVEPGGVSRRGLLKTAAGITFGLALGPLAGRAATETEVAQVSLWLRLDTAGNVTIYNPVAEMGQGSSTALPLIVAEEFDADWSAVKIEYAPIEPEIYGHDAIAGRMLMLTVGSHAVEAYFDRLRYAGAQARQVLLEIVAQAWKMPVDSLTTSPGEVHHLATGRSASYAEVARLAQTTGVPTPAGEPQLKSYSEFRLLGRDVRRPDVAAKVDGSAGFAMDISVPNMLHGMIQRAPVHGQKPLQCNAEQLLEDPAITGVYLLDHGVGIVGTRLWAVMAAKKKLHIEWSQGALAERFNSRAIFSQYAQIAEGSQTKATVIKRVEGAARMEDSAKGSDTASSQSREISATYLNDAVYHAQMEPLNALADVKPGSVDIWVGSQFPSGLRAEIASHLNMDIKRVTVHPCLLGGGFGRRSWHDFGMEAVQLSKLSGRPVKLLWDRADDLKYGAYRPASLQTLRASVDAAGSVNDWRHRVVGDNPAVVATGVDIPFYAIARQHMDLVVVPSGIRTKHWRALGHGPNKFAIESFVDEIAAASSQTPADLRRSLLADSPRALAVLERVIAFSSYRTGVNNGRAMGLAFAELFGTVTAGVVEVSLDKNSGVIRVHNVWVAVDAGLVIQPRNATRQIEGAILQSLSSVLYESVTIEAGAVQQSNFNDYPILRMAAVPRIHVAFIESQEAPAGIGEMAVPFVAPAVANGVAQLSGKRLRHLPFTAEKVLASLALEG